MQTFLPFADFDLSVASLDQSRLGKQRVETLQIMKALLTGSGWIHHTATRMWRGYEGALMEYQWATYEEWVWQRGYKDTTYEKTADLVTKHRPEIWHMRSHDEGYYPPWLGRPKFHRSHQSNLLRKAREYFLHHHDLPHPPHSKCDGVTPHKPHHNCDPGKLWRHYRPMWPEVPSNLPYVWPKGRS